MKTALYMLALTAVFLWVFWYVYIIVMGLYRAFLDGRLTRLTKALALPALALGLVMDVLTNITIASVAFHELPREWLVTDRLARHLNGTPGWRRSRALWVCTTLLDYFDPSGTHCR